LVEWDVETELNTIKRMCLSDALANERMLKADD